MRTTSGWPANVDYEILERLTGKKRNALHQDHTRGYFDPHDLESLAIYLARNGSIQLRMRMMVNAMSHDAVDRAGLRGSRKDEDVAKRAAKKTAKKKKSA